MTFARLRKRDESGFTLPEMIATIVIMGIVVVPLCNVLLLTLTIPTSSGQRSQNASDRDNAQVVFAQDITQATQVTTFNAPTCTPGCAQNPNPASLDTSVSPYTVTPLASPVSLPCKNTTNPWSILKTAWTDSSSGTAHAPTYQLNWKTVLGNANYLYVELHRVDSQVNTDVPLLRGYCQLNADQVASTAVSAASSVGGNTPITVGNSPGLLNVTTTISLRDNPNSTSPLTPYNFAGTTRVQN